MKRDESPEEKDIFREEVARKGTEYTPWYSGQNKFATQRGTGGFLKVRDVLPHVTVSDQRRENE